MSAILTLNAGSSSVKFSLYATSEDPERIVDGQVEKLGPSARFIMDGQTREIGTADHAAALPEILEAIASRHPDLTIVGIGHRIVHGGTDFDAPVVLSPDILLHLERFNALAPLHQPHNLSMVSAAQSAFPGTPQIGCFDTAFHRGHPWVNDTFALPRRFYDEGVRRYGFHGLSYQYITDVLKRDFPDLLQGRVVVAHLGNGASMCAIRSGRSIGSTMGFSALDGLPMGTRCGQLDPGVLLYFLDQGMKSDEISDLLYRESGLKGLSGIGSDMRTLLQSDDPRAAEAIDYYVFRIRRELGAMSAVLGGIDALVFCGGIGENAAEIRARVIDGMDYLGLALDAPANDVSKTEIGSGRARVLVIPTNEERVIARAVAAEIL